MYALKVEKMSCGGCANRVTRTVQALDPEAKVEVREDVVMLHPSPPPVHPKLVAIRE